MRMGSVAALCVAGAVLCSGAARADSCSAARDQKECVWITGHEYEGMIVAKIASTVCPDFMSGAAVSVIELFERADPHLTAAIKAKIESAFADDPEKACRTAYDALGPGGYMTNWFGGPLIRLRLPAPPDDFMSDYRRR